MQDDVMNKPATLSFPIPRRGNPLHPPAEYAQLREEQPATKVKMWNGTEAWILTRWQDVKDVLSNTASFSADPNTPGYPFLTPARQATVNSYQTFITMDPPQHGFFRRMLTRDFSQKRMQDLLPLIEEYVDTLLDDMIAHGSPADFVQFVSLKLPVTVVSMLIGVPYKDHEKLEAWSAAKLDLTLTAEESSEASRQMYDYFDELLTAEEANPGDSEDMLSRLVREQILPGTLNRVDALHMIILLYFAGHETTANAIALGVLSFLLEPGQRRKLKDDPELLRAACEEMLRFHTPPHLNACRVAIKDTEVGEVTIKAGEGVYPLLIAANRDPAMFANPDRFDIERANTEKQMAFSFGIHRCIGQPLARLEMQCVFRKLFERLPDLELAAPLEELPFKRDMYVYGLHALPVRW